MWSPGVQRMGHLVMADIIDAANALAAALADDEIARIQRLSAPERHPEFDGESCVACGGPIHPTRLEMGKVRCVDCQHALELGAR